MDKTYNISLGGFSFTIEEGAYQMLIQYLKNIRKYLGDTSDTEEIISDIEQRMAELLKERIRNREVIQQQDIDYLIEILGSPEQYTLEQDEPNNDKKRTNNKEENFINNINNYLKNKKLYRDIENKRLAGVLAGLSHYLNVKISLLRFVFLFLLFSPTLGFYFKAFGAFLPLGGTWLVIYVILWIIVPKATTPSEKLEMQGKMVTIDTLSSFKNQEFSTKKELKRSSKNAKLAGVLGGFAEYYSIDASLLRVVYIILLLGLGILPKLSVPLLAVYFLLWISLSKKDDSDDGTSPKEEHKTNSQIYAEQINQNRTANSAPKNSFFAGFWSLLKFLIKGFLFFVLTLFAIITICIIFALILAFFGIGVGSWGVLSFLIHHKFWTFWVDSDWQIILGYISMGIFFTLPFVAITFLYLKLFSKRSYAVSKALFVLTIISILSSVFIIMNTIASFSTKAFSEETIATNISSDTLLLYPKTLNFDPNHRFVFDNFFVKDNESIISAKKSIQFSVKQTDKKEPFFKIRKEALGKNITNAQKNIQSIIYEFATDSTSATIPNYFTLTPKGKIRMQKINVTLYLPKEKYIACPTQDYSVWCNTSGKKITIGEGKVAQMTEQGLTIVSE